MKLFSHIFIRDYLLNQVCTIIEVGGCERVQLSAFGRTVLRRVTQDTVKRRYSNPSICIFLCIERAR